MSNLVSLREFKTANQRRDFISQNLKLEFREIQNLEFQEDKVIGRNIENLVGAISIPLGIAGPLKIKAIKKSYFVPFATTEGALVASINRGMRAIYLSGGASVNLEEVGITRGPVFETKGIFHGLRVKSWIEKNFKLLKEAAESTSSHLKLIKAETSIVGKNLFIRFYFDTDSAMGMNMATFATEKIARIIERENKIYCVAIAGNFDIDKKSAWLNFISGRGKKVWAEVTLKKEIVKKVLKTTPEKIAEVVYRKCLVGSAISGSLGFNSHFANIIAALFLATGQDPAHVVEGSLGITNAEGLKNGDLYFSIFLPSLLVGIVGGGTSLPTQQEALNIIGVKKSSEFAKIIAASVLAGELSLISSLSEGSLAKAHKNLGRNKNG